MPRIALVAGEASGDLLGAGLIEALRERFPDARFEGVAGPRMQAVGCEALFPAERLAVMGLTEVVRHLPELLRIRRTLVAAWTRDPPDVFVGVDAPDFNLGLELKLRRAGIPTVHYVSPSVWAWRQYRVRKIARAVDLMLTLLPFEAKFYEEHGVPVRFVGHPMADDIPLHVNKDDAKRALGLRGDAPVLAVLPGSRRTEVEALGEIFLRAAQLLQRERAAQICIPAATPAIREMITTIATTYVPALQCTVLDGKARELLAAADAALIASGTATLEAALLHCPMAVAYRLSPMTYAIATRLVKTPYVALPNLLAGEPLVPELIQERATPQALRDAVSPYLAPGERREGLVRAFRDMHATLRRNASACAADAVAACLHR